MKGSVQKAQAGCSARRAVRVWDGPTRVSHWALVTLVITSWATADNGLHTWHRVSGYAVLVLVLFRIYWGFVGGTTGRFSHFLRGPVEVGRYLRDALGASKGRQVIGHNPAGGWSAIAMLMTLLIQAGLGLFAVDVYGFESGPLARYVSFEMGQDIAELHGGTTFNLLLVLILFHVVAVFSYLIVKRDNLIFPMLTGVKWDVGADNDPPIVEATRLRAAIGICASVLFVLTIIYGL